MTLRDIDYNQVEREKAEWAAATREREHRDDVIGRWIAAVLLTAIAALVVSAFAYAEDYQCKTCGCFATISTGGIQRDVMFRKGDVVSTDSGWVIFPDDGWVKIRSRKLDGTTMDVWMLLADSAHGRVYTRDAILPMFCVASSTYYGLLPSDGWSALTMAGEPEPMEMCLVGVSP